MSNAKIAFTDEDHKIQMKADIQLRISGWNTNYQCQEWSFMLKIWLVGFYITPECKFIYSGIIKTI